ncbi:MAG: PEP-CTERM sorting domain-containing protein [Gemmatimonadaceae bacterium]|nr:PEP-CTERM sorting domain-containing protein [Gemmatimonadaceae bacterium]
MTHRSRYLSIACGAAVALLPLGLSAQLISTPTFFAVNPTGMYLRGDGVLGSPLVLDLGLSSYLRTITLKPTGVLQVAGSGSPYHDAVYCGVFSTSSTLLASTELNRVVGAIAPPANVFGSCQTQPTFYGNQPTDVSNDFFISFDGLTITVPTSSRFLFIAIPDDYAPDNVSPDPSRYGIYASMTTTVPEPSSIALSALGLFGLGLFASRRRTRFHS